MSPEFMSEKKPSPIVVVPQRKLCPICKKPTYSSTGIHPQCAMVQADTPRQARLAAARKASADAKADSVNEKACPKCHAVLPASGTPCDCGFVVSGK